MDINADLEVNNKLSTDKCEHADKRFKLSKDQEVPISGTSKKGKKKSKNNGEDSGDDGSDKDDGNVDDENDGPPIPPEGFNYPLEMDSSDMLDEVELDNGRWPTVTERYFTPYYVMDVPKPGEDICVRVHSNRICMISIASGHVIFEENKTIVKCDYKVSDKVDRSTIVTSGKSKHGAQPMQENANICRLTCSDGSVYTVKCCMIGKLLEVNEALKDDPEMLKLEPHHGGYIGLVLPNLKHLDRLKGKMLTQELYGEAVKKRKEKKMSEQESVKMGTKEEENTDEKTESISKENNAYHEVLSKTDSDLEKKPNVNTKSNENENLNEEFVDT